MVFASAWPVAMRRWMLDGEKSAELEASSTLEFEIEMTRVIVINLFPDKGVVPATMLEVWDRMIELHKAPSGEGSQAQIEAFEDTWHWNDAAKKAFDEVMQTLGSLLRRIDATDAARIPRADTAPCSSPSRAPRPRACRPRSRT